MSITKRQQKAFLRPFQTPEGMLPTDFLVITPDGTVIPLCPEVLGVDWAAIRAKMADLDTSQMLTLGDILHENELDH
jgi:hypothetical protein